MYVHYVHAWYSQKPEGIGSQEMNPGTLQEQPVLLSAELSLQPLGDAILQAAFDFIWSARTEQDDLVVHVGITTCPASMRQTSI